MQTVISLITKATAIDEVTALLEQMEEGKEYVLEIKEKSERAAGGTIKPLVIERILRGVDNKTILKEVTALVPSSKTTKESIAWYRSQLNKTVYYPLIKEIRKAGLVAELDDKEIVKQLQAWNVSKFEDAKLRFEDAEKIEDGETETETTEKEEGAE